MMTVSHQRLWTEGPECEVGLVTGPVDLLVTILVVRQQLRLPKNGVSVPWSMILSSREVETF